MFTSPPQHKMRDDDPGTPVLETGMKNFPPVVDSTHRISRRMWWTLILVPLAFVLITASTRYLHPSAFDLFMSMPDSLSCHERSSNGRWQPLGRDKQPERRQVSASPAVNSSSVIALSPSVPTSTSTTAAANAPVPTIPSSPPALPTPFPQPFEDLAQNFSSTSCFNFFSNMTAALPFRSCRPLSFLIDSSSSFIDAQANLTLMNSIIWGTCNTTIAEDQCIANMGWFADALQTACDQDLQEQNQMAVSALRDLRAYGLMRDAGCLMDPASNTYCYLNAVRSSNLYFYYLPLGIPVPNTTKPLCTACTRDLMLAYSSALSNTTEADALTGLKQTYGNAAKMAVAQCGTEYADTTVASKAPAALLRGCSWWTGVAVLLLGVILQVLS
ncbi:hypothetical protein C0995_001627 [Termitomyces sp. Mi166|nr:hypothetical protein C0995_001627 [Termitomyces sp. Mi166\